MPARQVFDVRDPRPEREESQPLSRPSDVAGFCGYAERGPLHDPVRVESFQQFRARFGPHVEHGYLAFAVAGFFANGGRACWVVRIADPTSAAPARARVRDAQGNVLFTLAASSPGSWGNQLQVRIEAGVAGSFRLGVGDGSGTSESFENLRVGGGLGDVCSALNQPVTGSQLLRASAGEARFAPLRAPPRSGVYRFEGGCDGLARVTTEHFLGSERNPEWGLATLLPIDEVGLLAVPDAHPVPERESAALHRVIPLPDDLRELRIAPVRELPPRFDAAAQRSLRLGLVRACEQRRDRMAIVDLPNVGASRDALLAHRSETDSSYAAAYYPWLLVIDPFQRDGPLCAVPPSGFVAGVYARTDLTLGVHRPPANVPLFEVRGLATHMSDALHAALFQAHVNAIVEVYGRGPRVIGARTLSDDVSLRYVHVRRLLINLTAMLEAEGALLVFEPSRRGLASAVQSVVRAVLERLWNAGALDGASFEQACTLRCIAPEEPSERIVCDVSLTPPFPAESVALRIVVSASRLEVEELTARVSDAKWAPL